VADPVRDRRLQPTSFDCRADEATASGTAVRAQLIAGHFAGWTSSTVSGATPSVSPKCWSRWRSTQPCMERPRKGSGPRRYVRLLSLQNNGSAAHAPSKPPAPRDSGLLQDVGSSEQNARPRRSTGVLRRSPFRADASRRRRDSRLVCVWHVLFLSCWALGAIAPTTLAVTWSCNSKTLRHDTVASGVNDAAAMFGDHREHDRQVILQVADGPRLVGPHQGAVASNVSGENCCQPAGNRRFFRLTFASIPFVCLVYLAQVRSLYV
jgi:hypothetical protein